MRGGILDVFPLASPWPVRFEFFGDEIESLRTFDPQTQISREKIDRTTISPGGELGILKQQLDADANYATGRLGDFLAGEPLCLLVEPDDIAERVADYLGQVPSGDLFHDDWETALGQARERGTIVELRETGDEAEPPFESLDAYRPLGESAGDPQICRRATGASFSTNCIAGCETATTVWVVCGTEGELQRFRRIVDRVRLGQAQGRGQAGADARQRGSRFSCRVGQAGCRHRLGDFLGAPARSVRAGSSRPTRRRRARRWRSILPT